ncbi:hypothetical protein [Bacillus arachidis]|uniref:Uncharacterized protein n=1 Tax=Bacillus arachidis TaxID=2819290 RepID=A0ABS3P600_9BACI|nr:hypothetical protein [Bacillus arachidis]MBO1628488.1 hypothetical protein [Bacillus arachidis]
MKNMLKFIKVLFASLLVFSSVAFINPIASHAQENLISSEISTDEPTIQRARGDGAYFNGLMIRYGVFSNDNVWTWDRANYDHPIENLAYHYEKHKNDKGINSKDMAQYMRQALEFKRNLKGAKVVKAYGDTPDVYKYSKNGKYIMIHKPSGLIVSFGSQ